jgi:hypothetical protein
MVPRGKRKDDSIDTGGLRDRFMGPKHISHPFSSYRCAGTQKKSEHDASAKHEYGFVRALLQRWRCPGNDADILDAGTLRGD